MYIIKKYNAEGRNAGFVHSHCDYRQVAKFETYRVAAAAAAGSNKTSKFRHEVELAADHDCTNDLAALMVHA